MAHAPTLVAGTRPDFARLAAAVLLIFVCVSWSGPARAEERRNAWEMSILGGQTFYGNEHRIANEPHYGLRFGWYFRPAYEVELQVLETKAAQIQNVNSTLISDPSVFFANEERTFESRSYTLRFLINPRNERRRLKPYVLFGAGVLGFTPDPDLDKTEEGELDAKIVTVGGGLRQRLTAHMALRIEFEAEYAVSEVYHNEHINIGLTWVFGGGPPADSDGDGILDLRDRCPDTPKGAIVDKHDGCPWDLDLDGVMEGIDVCADTPRNWPVDARGCPLDSDGDRVPDGADTCADTPAGAIVDARGCPVDSDGDTVYDGVDRCPGTPVGAFVDPPDSPTAGCPHDTDGDGSFDGVDKCPLTPPGANVDDSGCPSDSDDDKVLEGIDQCPDSPAGQRIDRDGCPRVRLDKSEPQILQNVKFHGSDLYPGSDAWLMLLVEAARYWPAVTFEVGLYTDNEGGREANRQAASRRAEIIKAFLVEQGITADRIVTKAYGPVNFVADNETEEGRERNRRIEVKYLSGNVRRHPKPEPIDPGLLRDASPPAAAPAAPAPPAAPQDQPGTTPGAEEGASPGAGDEPTPPADDAPPGDTAPPDGEDEAGPSEEDEPSDDDPEPSPGGGAL